MENRFNRIPNSTTVSAAPSWLPDFCGLPVLFVAMVVAELVVLVVLIAPSEESRPFLHRLVTASVFVQWLALLCAVCLCKLKPWIGQLTPGVGVLLTHALIITITALGSMLVFFLDQALGLHLTLPASFQLRFVLGNVAICALIAAALLRYFYVLEQWRERVRAAAKAQFDALQARIRPHFLFNSMNTIASLIRNRPQEAERAIEDLSDLFRAALGSGNALSTLEAELALIQRYLDLERLRLGERLRVHWDIDALPSDLSLPPLLLQPLVENAVYHGIQQLTEGGTVEILGTRCEGAIEITIRNPCPPLSTPTRSRNGIALANIRSRIEYHFGHRGELAVTADSDFFTCTVRLPDESAHR